MKKHLLLLCFIVCMLQSHAQSLAHVRNNRLGKGINLSNWMEAYWHGTDWPKPNLYDRAFLVEMKTAGFKSIRLPICFALVTDSVAPYNVDTTSPVFAQVDSVIKWADELNMYLIIDNHHQWTVTNYTWRTQQPRLAHLWSVLAQRYKYLDPEQYFFEVMNEPHEINNDSLNLFFAPVIDTIRKYTTAHTLVVSPAQWSSGFGYYQYLPLADTNLIYALHCYDPYPFTHQGFSWANPYYGIGYYYPGSGYDFVLPGQWQLAMQWRDSFDRPIFLGEFGVGIYPDPISRCNWIDTVGRLIDTYGVPSFSWDVRWDFGLYKSGVISADSVIPCFAQALRLYGQTDVKNVKQELPIEIFPNPASDVVVCSTNTPDEILLEVADNMGRKIFEKRFTNKYNINTQGWAVGVYLLKVTSGNATTVEKIVIRE